ncbi:MAG TPA: ABC transporter permease [Polyangiaceae bacterium]|jgi:putative ABC transport system permease protein
MSFDGLRELFDTVNRNRLRTALTALSVAWGIFMLVILLAAGTGLERGVAHNFRDDAVNSIWIRPGKTSLPHAGHTPGRSVQFTNDDMAAVSRSVSGIEHITGRFYLWGEYFVSYGQEHGSFDIRGCHPDHRYLEKTLMLAGRFIDDLDIEKRRKVAVIGPEVRTALFKGKDPLGEYVKIRGVNYRVVGVFEDEGGQNELRKIYIPISTAQLVYHGADRLHHIMYTVGDASTEASERMVAETRALLARRHDFSPQDRRAVNIQNNLQEFQRIKQIFDWIRAFVWIVGIGTIFAGVVGVSNIMLISVQERTKEIGIRKAIGATPWSIVSSILQEAVLVTSAAGYSGLVAGVALVEFVSKTIPENDYVRNPEVDLRMALVATFILVACGALAGLVPAVRAARVKPVVAMREE